MTCHMNDARSEQESEIKTFRIDNSKQALELLVFPKPGVRPPYGPVVPGGGGVLGGVPGGVPIPGVVPPVPVPGVVPPPPAVLGDDGNTQDP